MKREKRANFQRFSLFFCLTWLYLSFFIMSSWSFRSLPTAPVCCYCATLREKSCDIHGRWWWFIFFQTKQKSWSIQRWQSTCVQFPFFSFISFFIPFCYWQLEPIYVYIPYDSHLPSLCIDEAPHVEDSLHDGCLPHRNQFLFAGQTAPLRRKG